MPAQDDTSIAAPLAIGGGLAAAPFAGLLGEQKITKDPYYSKKVKRLSPRELERLARPGDVILTSQRAGTSLYKSPQLYTTGSEFYHAEPIIARSRGLGRTIPAGLLENMKGQTPQQIRKRKGGVKSYTQPIPFDEYQDIALMRPEKKLTKAQIRQFQDAIITGGVKPYSKPMGVRALFRDLFTPKIPGVTGHTGPMGCKGSMCSSLPAVSWDKIFKERIARGKHPGHTLPADFLRSGSHFNPVAASIGNPEILKHILAKRMAFRGALGAGMGGAGVAAYHEPEILPGVAAAAGVPMGVQAILNKTKAGRGDQMLPGGMSAIEYLASLKNARRAGRKVPKALAGAFKRFGTRTVPLALGSGLAAYLGTKDLSN